MSSDSDLSSEEFDYVFLVGQGSLFLGINLRANINFEVIFKYKKTVSNARKLNRNRRKHQESILQKEAVLNSLFLEDCIGNTFDFNQE